MIKGEGGGKGGGGRYSGLYVRYCLQGRHHDGWGYVTGGAHIQRVGNTATDVHQFCIAKRGFVFVVPPGKTGV